MKTKVEINGYEITIEESNGVISVSATFEDEVVEEFSIEIEEGQEGQEDEEGQDIQSFDEYEEEEDLDSEEEGQDEDEDEDEEIKLESFHSFINKKK